MRCLVKHVILAACCLALSGCDSGAESDDGSASASIDEAQLKPEAEAPPEDTGTDEAAAPVPVAAGFELQSVLCATVEDSDPNSDVRYCTAFEGVELIDVAVTLPKNARGITVKVTEPRGSLALVGVSYARFIKVSGGTAAARLAAWNGSTVTTEVKPPDEDKPTVSSVTGKEAEEAYQRYIDQVGLDLGFTQLHAPVVQASEPDKTTTTPAPTVEPTPEPAVYVPPAATPAPTPAPTATPTPAPTPSPSPSPSPSASPTPETTTVTTVTATPTTAVQTNAPTATPTDDQTSSPTASPTPNATPTTPTSTPTPSSSPTASPTESPTPMTT